AIVPRALAFTGINTSELEFGFENGRALPGQQLVRPGTVYETRVRNEDPNDMALIENHLDYVPDGCKWQATCCKISSAVGTPIPPCTSSCSNCNVSWGAMTTTPIGCLKKSTICQHVYENTIEGGTAALDPPCKTYCTACHRLETDPTCTEENRKCRSDTCQTLFGAMKTSTQSCSGHIKGGHVFE
ncbi:hypothetical protein HDU99_000764, partial [Rhizoclosmatium hyalinum]